MNSATHFADPLSVEAWDAWFRWRTPAGLQDLTIDDTWTRVARAVAAVEGSAASEWSARFAHALRQWQMLPDEGLLAQAGTGSGRIGGQRAAVINAAAFVIGERGHAARIDHARLAEVAALAMRYLCDAIRLDAGDANIEPSPHIGLLGVADAIAALGLRYDSEAARLQAGEIAATIHAACLDGLARYLDELEVPPPSAIAAMLPASGDPSCHPARSIPGRPGTRTSWITALTPHPHLALLANRRGDMVDASARTPRPGSGASASGQLTATAIGKSAYQAGSRPAANDPGCDDPAARVLMRAAVQPWIDMPISAPYPVEQMPDPAVRAYCADLARRNGLPTPRWHALSAPLPPTPP